MRHYITVLVTTLTVTLLLVVLNTGVSKHFKRFTSTEPVTPIKQLIETNLANFNTNFTVPYDLKTTQRSLDNIIESQLYEYYITKYNIKSVGNSTTIAIEFNITKSEMDEVDKYVADIIMSMPSDIPDIEHKLIYYINSIVKDNKYYSNSTQDINPYSPYSAVKYQTGVCQAYTLLFKKFLDYEGIPNWLVDGTVSENDHIWNIIELDKQYYHIDLTYILSLRDVKPDNLYYYLLADIQLSNREYTNPNGFEATSLKYAYLNKNYDVSNLDVNNILKLSLTTSKETLSNKLNLAVDDFTIYPMKDMYSFSPKSESNLKDFYLVALKIHNTTNYYLSIVDTN